MADKTRVVVRAWSETISGTTRYFLDGIELLSSTGTIPLTQLGSYARGALIVGGATGWQNFAHPGALGYLLQSTALDTEWSRDLTDLQSIQFDLTPSVTAAEGLLYWNDTDKTLNLGMSGGNVSLQVGQEMLLRVYNDSGVNIVNGDVVYISGGSGATAYVSLADPDAVGTASAIGMATENIDDHHHGYITTRGLVRGDATQPINTNAYAVGTVLWLTDDGKWTGTKPTAPDFSVVVGVVVRKHATEGVIYTNIDIVPRLQSLSDVTISGIAGGDLLQWDAGDARWENKPAATAVAHAILSTTHSDSTAAAVTRGAVITGQGASPTWASLALGSALEAVSSDGTDVVYRGFHPDNGFVNRTDSTLGMSGSNFQVTTGSSYVFYSAGKRFSKNATESIAISSDLTQHFVYFDTAGAIQVSAGTAWTISSDNVPIAIVYKDGATYAVLDERHGYRRDRWWHEWAHDTIGARYESGLAGTFADTTFSIAQGVIHDEDIELNTGGTKTSCRLWYRNAGATAMRFESAITRPWKISATPAPQYDDGGTLTDVTANRYFCSYVYATNDQDYPIYIVVGQAQYTTVAGARNDSLPATPGQITREWKLLYRVIYQRNGGSATYIEATDFRETSTGPGSTYTPASHTALTNRDAASSHPASAITEGVTIGRVMQSNSSTGALEAAALVGPASNVLTFTATAASTLAAAISSGKTLTLTTTDNYNLTIPKTGTAVVGTGTATRIAEWVTDANTLQASTLIKSGVGVLTVSSATTSTLTTAITASKTLTLTATDDYNLTIPKTGTAVTGTGTAGRVAAWVTDANTLQAAALIAPASNVLTLTATAASTLALAISSAKTLTLTATDNYNLTVSGSCTVNDWFDQSVKAAATPTFASIITAEDGYVGVTSGVRAVFNDSAGQLDLTLGDAAGADEVRVVDSGGVDVATLDSDGNLQLDGTLQATARNYAVLYVSNNTSSDVAYILGRVNSESGSTGSTERGYVDIECVNARDYGDTNTAGTRLWALTRSSAVTAKHINYGTLGDTDANRGYFSIYNDGSNNFNLYYTAPAYSYTILIVRFAWYQALTVTAQAVSGSIAYTTAAAGTNRMSIGALETSGNALIGTSTDGMTASGSIAIAQDLAHRGTKAGFYNTTPITKPTVSGARDDPEGALADLLTELANLGLITNSTTAS